MRRMLRKAIPSMFHRRLVLLGLAVSVALFVMMVKTVAMSVGDAHRARLAEAEAALEVQTLIPTVRGRILDRHGRVLAYDDAGWEVAVDYQVIIGEWARDQAETLARRKNKATWAELSDAERSILIDAEQPPFNDQVEMLWQTLAELGQVDRLEIERRKDAIRQRVQVLKSYLQRVWWEKKQKELGVKIPFQDAAQPISEERQAHTLLPKVTEETRVAIQGFIAEAGKINEGIKAGSTEINPMLVWTEVELRRPKQRLYPFETMTLVLDRSTMPSPLRREEPLEMTVEGVAAHILGGMRDVWQKDMEGEDARPFYRPGSVPDLGGYLPGDRVGHGGIEGAMESTLRGRRGVSIHHIDTGSDTRTEPLPGGDVHLTLDIALQARIQAIMTPNPTPDWPGLLARQEWHGKAPAPEVDPVAYQRWRDALGAPMNGAAVVLDVETSEVLAAVSMPTMPHRILEENPKMLYGDIVNTPWINRVIARPYQPGSTIKPIMLVSAVTAGAHPGDPIVCLGPFDPEKPDQMRCWIFKHYLTSHGPLTAPEAIQQSCNVYFYTLGQKMGLQRTIDWYRRFGLGEPTNCGLGVAGKGGEEVGGAVGNPRQSYPADAIFMGIGQGPVNWTPLQAAGAYATLARGGLHLSPTIIKDEDRLTRRKAVDLQLSSSAVHDALEGLDMAVNTRLGTGNRIGTLREEVFNVEGVKVMGKSGTADPGSRWIDANRNGKQDPGEVDTNPGDHAWLIALVQPEGASRPTHVVAVVIEYAGSGGQIAGPVVNQIIHAMQEENYF